MDARGDFSAWRKALLEYYPRDLWLKKLAARCMNMAQAGQYNLPRALRRGETVCAMLAASRFAEAALGMLFLLNRRYMPFYKWAWHIGRDLPFLGEYTADALKRIASTPLVGSGGEAVCREVEALCSRFAEALRAFLRNGFLALGARPASGRAYFRSRTRPHESAGGLGHFIHEMPCGVERSETEASTPPLRCRRNSLAAHNSGFRRETCGSETAPGRQDIFNGKMLRDARVSASRHFLRHSSGISLNIETSEWRTTGNHYGYLQNGI